MTTKIPAERLAAYHARLAERRRREAELAQSRPAIVWLGQYDEVYLRGMAWLDADDGAPMVPASDVPPSP